MIKKTPIIIFLCCIVSIIVIPVLTAEAKTSPPKSHTDEYEKWGITIDKKVYYYDGKRVRIFQDVKADDSFEYSFVDIKGTIDIRLLRNRKGVITKLERISKEEADEILEDYYDNDDINNNDTDKDSLINASDTSLISTDSKKSEQTSEKKNKASKADDLTDIKRCLISEVPSDIQKAIENCTGKGFFVIKGNQRQYVYYNQLPRDYAFQSEGTTLKVFDIGSKKGIYVLLSLPKDVDFSLYYNSKKVTYTKVIA